jgi:hypothetical protein
MGGIINFLIGIIASLLLYFSGNNILFWISTGFTFALFWSWGIMHNFAYNAARKRRNRLKENKIREGAPPEIIQKIENSKIIINQADLNQVPNYISSINILLSIIEIIFLIIGLIGIF